MEAIMDKYKNAPMMMLLCKISEEKERQEKERKERQKTGQDRDPRVPYDVLVQEGISPNPGPSDEKQNDRLEDAPRGNLRRAGCRGGMRQRTKWIIGLLAMAVMGKVNATTNQSWNHNVSEIAWTHECQRESKKSGCPAAGGPVWDISAGIASSEEDLKPGGGLEVESKKNRRGKEGLRTQANWRH